MQFARAYHYPSGRSYDLMELYGGTTPLGVPISKMPSELPESSEPSKIEGVGVKDIGMSVPLGISAGNVEGVSAKIRSGVVNIELAFPGTFHGQRQGQTPEMYGIDQRRALKELSKATEVNFTTHAAYGIMGMTGQDQQGNFSNTRWMAAVNEVKRAIEFASDTAGGGSVVVHTGEFDRPLTHIYPDGIVLGDDGRQKRNYSRDEEGRLMFQKRTTESADFSFQLLDDRTGQVFETVQGDRVAAQPIWKRAKEDRTYVASENDPSGKPSGTVVHVKKGDYIDYENRLIEDPFNIRFIEKKATVPKGGRVPEYDPETGRFKVEMKHHDDFEREAKEYNESYLRIIGGKPENWFYKRQTGREMFLKSTLMTQAGHSRGWALQYGERVDKHLDNLKKLKELKDYYEKIDKNLPEDEKWKIMRQDVRYGYAETLLPPETKHPLEQIEKAIKEERKSLEFAQQSSSSQEMQSYDTLETMRHIITPEKFVEEHGSRGYALAAIHAMELSRDPNNPIVITMENLFPERYGGHPQELKWLVEKAKNHFVGYLTQPKYMWTESDANWFKEVGMEDPGTWAKGRNPMYRQGLSEEEAKKLADQHLKITLDTGHLNMWRKYFQPKPGLSEDENEKLFNKWMLDQVEDLAKNKLIGNVHLTDNYGYQDDHLAPGQGNTPVREIVKILKKHGYDKALTVEPGASASTDASDFHGLMQTWKYFGSPTYGLGGPIRVGAPPRGWSDIQDSYFGAGAPPYFVFGAYAPSNDWTLWSQVPME